VVEVSQNRLTGWLITN